jgi:hypothetical protein
MLKSYEVPQLSTVAGSGSNQRDPAATLHYGGSVGGQRPPGEFLEEDYGNSGAPRRGQTSGRATSNM